MDDWVEVHAPLEVPRGWLRLRRIRSSVENAALLAWPRAELQRACLESTVMFGDGSGAVVRPSDVGGMSDEQLVECLLDNRHVRRVRATHPRARRRYG